MRGEYRLIGTLFPSHLNDNSKFTPMHFKLNVFSCIRFNPFVLKLFMILHCVLKQI